jgi:hypothetical protein
MKIEMPKFAPAVISREDVRWMDLDLWARRAVTLGHIEHLAHQRVQPFQRAFIQVVCTPPGNVLSKSLFDSTATKDEAETKKPL